jgi:hypothetical protein
MKRIRPDILFVNLRAAELRLDSSTPGTRITPSDRQSIGIFLGYLTNECRNAELTLSSAFLSEIQNHFSNQDLSYSALSPMLHELIHRIRDELSLSHFLLVSAGKTEFLDQPAPFGPTVNFILPDAREDILEAVKCYALERNTACVFHLMRAVEVGLKALCEHTGETLPENPNWGQVISTTDKALQISGSAKQDPQRVAASAEALAYLRIIKDAWRNPTMHVTRSYDEEQALDILRASRRFLQELAKILQMPSAKKP